MNIGDYVRTKSNGIQKIDEEGRINLGLIRPPFHIIKKEELLKSSPNIIDLIEVGDYVNGEHVTDVSSKKEYLEISREFIYLEPKDIKSIVTKEQFSQMEYKVGSDNKRFKLIEDEKGNISLDNGKKYKTKEIKGE